MPTTSLLRNVSWLTLGNAIAKPVWLAFITVACIRFLGVEGYGIFTASLFLTAITRSFSDLGITQYSIREVARKREEAPVFFSNFLPAKVVLSVAAVGVALVIGATLGYDDSKIRTLFFAGIYTFGLSLVEYCRCYFRAFEIMRYEALSVIVEKVLVVGFGLTFLLTFKTPAGVLGGMTIGIIITAVITIYFTKDRLANLKRNLFSGGFILRALPAAIPLGLASQFVVVYFRADAVMLDAMVGNAAAGQYAAAYRLIEAFMLISTLVTTVVYPRLSSLYHQKKPADFQRILRLSSLAVGAIGVVVATGLYVFADGIMLALKGDASFLPAAGALKILAWIVPFMCINGLMSIALSATDDQRMLALFLGGAAAMNISLNMALIPEFSFIGACVATLATEGAVTAVLGTRYLTHTTAVLGRLR